MTTFKLAGHVNPTVPLHLLHKRLVDFLCDAVTEEYNLYDACPIGDTWLHVEGFICDVYPTGILMAYCAIELDKKTLVEPVHLLCSNAFFSIPSTWFACPGLRL